MLKILTAALVTEYARVAECEPYRLPACDRQWGDPVYDRESGETPSVVVFLDIDGVLNSTEWAHERVNLRDGRMVRKVYTHFVERLNWLHERVPGVGYVITSSNRLIHFGALKKMLRAQGFTGSVVDMTPSVPNGNREQEITAWLEAHRPSLGVSVVVFDDVPVSLTVDLPTLIVRVDGSRGLTEEDVETAITFLTE